MTQCKACTEFFKRYRCAAATHGECDCPKCQGYCECTCDHVWATNTGADYGGYRPSEAYGLKCYCAKCGIEYEQEGEEPPDFDNVEKAREKELDHWFHRTYKE